MDNILDRIRVGVISHNRPHNVERMHEMFGKELTWYVGAGERKEYEAEGAKVVESGGLVESRNAVLQDAWKEGKVSLTLEDDIRKMQVVKVIGVRKVVSDISFKEAATLMYNALEQSGLKMAGIPPTDNEFFYSEKKPFSYNNYVIGSFLMVKECDCLFDPQFATKEDYDYTLQHIKRYGGALRCNQLLFSVEHYKNKGGVVDIRTPQLEQESISKLKRKWGTNIIRDNPRRMNEILLKVGKK